MTRPKDPAFELYVLKAKCQSRLVRDVRNQFENNNMREYINRLHACKTATAVRKLMAAFEIEDATPIQDLED